MVLRGDIVVVSFPFLDGSGGKNRPALVIQSDTNNRRLDHTIVAMVTGNTSRIGKVATQFGIDPTTAEGASSGLHGPSAVKCEHLLTINESDVRQKIGHLDAPLLDRLNTCLKASLDLT